MTSLYLINIHTVVLFFVLLYYIVSSQWICVTYSQNCDKYKSQLIRNFNNVGKQDLCYHIILNIWMRMYKARWFHIFQLTEIFSQKQWKLWCGQITQKLAKLINIRRQHRLHILVKLSTISNVLDEQTYYNWYIINITTPIPIDLDNDWVYKSPRGQLRNSEMPSRQYARGCKKIRLKSIAAP